MTRFITPFKRLVPSGIKRAAKRVLGMQNLSNEPTDKADWEFWWQQTQWLELWKRPEIQAKCLEYWRKFRHYDEIRSLVPLDDSSRILDVGCGLSSVLHWLPGERNGVDPLGDRYKTIWKYPFEVIGASGERLPFPDEKFDAAFCSNCIDHVTNPAGVMGEVRRVLKPDGLFILTCEVFEQDLGERNAAHPWSMTKEKLLGLAERFTLERHWQSPWYGMRNYVLGGNPTEQTEHILLLRRSHDRP